MHVSNRRMHLRCQLQTYMFNISHFVGRRKFLAIHRGKHWLNIHFSPPPPWMIHSGMITRKRNSSRIRQKSQRVCINVRTYLLLYPELTRARSLPYPSPLSPLSRSTRVRRHTRNVPKRRANKTVRNWFNEVGRCRPCARGTNNANLRGGAGRASEGGGGGVEEGRWREARERRFKGKKEEVAAIKKERAEREKEWGKQKREESREGVDEHGEPVAASARQLEAQLQPGAVTSTLQSARRLHGKASRFASDNGAMTVLLSCRLPTPEELPRYYRSRYDNTA